MQETEPLLAQSGSRRLTTILAADICGYSSMSERDETLAISLSDITYDYFSEVVKSHNGRVFSRIADAFLAEFSSTVDGMKAALSFLKKLETHNKAGSKSDMIDIRMGLHVGDVTDRENGDIFGHGVNIAVRLQENAHINTALVSSNIVNLLQSKEEFNFQDKTQISLKNIARPITVYTLSATKFSFLNRILRRLPSSKNLSYGIGAVAGIALLLLYVNMRTTTAPLEVDDVLNAYFLDNSDGIETATFSTDYLRYVLDNLKGSNIDSERATFELLRSGNISGAIENLETYRRGRLTAMSGPLNFSSVEHITLLHQLAALSYHQDPSKAESYYKAILIAKPDDSRVKLWLARAQNQKGEDIEAEDVLSRIDDLDIVNANDLFQLRMDRAFNHLLKHDFEEGLNAMHALEEESQKVANPRLVLEWKTNMAIALERLGRLEEAETLVSNVINELNKIGADTNMPRAYSVWGQIYEQRAFESDPPDPAYLRPALEKYSQQYRYGQSLNKEGDMAESLHYMGAIHIALGEPEQAKHNYSMALLQADNLGYRRSSLRSQIGLAYLRLNDGQIEEACRMQASIKESLEKEGLPLRKRNSSLLTSVRESCN